MSGCKREEEASGCGAWSRGFWSLGVNVYDPQCWCSQLLQSLETKNKKGFLMYFLEDLKK